MKINSNRNSMKKLKIIIKSYFIGVLTFLLCFNLLSIQQYAEAQNKPQGKLFFCTSASANETSQLGCISYPEESQTIIAEDVKIRRLLYDESDGKLVCTKTNKDNSTLPESIYIYDIAQDKLTEKNIPVFVYGIWNNHLLTLRPEAPHWQVLDMEDDFKTLWTLDSTKVNGYLPVDCLIRNDKAFLLYSNHIQVIDLVNQDTLMSFDTPPPYTNQNYNTSFSKGMKNDRVFIDVEYATGAIRSSLLELIVDSLKSRIVFHKEGAASFRPPVVAGNRVYLYAYDSYYDLETDSLYFKQGFEPSTILYDELSESLFTYNNSGYIQYHQNGMEALEGIGLNGLLVDYLFASDKTNVVYEVGLNKEGFDIDIYPNPLKNNLNIRLEKKFDIINVKFYNVKGQEVLRYEVNKYLQEVSLPLHQLTKGMYVAEVIIREDREIKSASRKFVLE